MRENPSIFNGKYVQTIRFWWPIGDFVLKNIFFHYPDIYPHTINPHEELNLNVNRTPTIVWNVYSLPTQNLHSKLRQFLPPPFIIHFRWSWWWQGSPSQQAKSTDPVRWNCWAPGPHPSRWRPIGSTARNPPPCACSAHTCGTFNISGEITHLYMSWLFSSYCNTSNAIRKETSKYLHLENQSRASASVWPNSSTIRWMLGGTVYAWI